MQPNLETRDQSDQTQTRQEHTQPKFFNLYQNAKNQATSTEVFDLKILAQISGTTFFSNMEFVREHSK